MGRKPKPAWCLPRRRLRLDPRRSNPTACTERPCCAPTRSPQPSFRSVRVRTPTLLVLVPRGQFSCAVLVEPRGCPALGMLPVDRLAMLVKFEEAREDRETSVITQSLSCTITSSALTRSERLACRLPPRSAAVCAFSLASMFTERDTRPWSLRAWPSESAANCASPVCLHNGWPELTKPI
jgi:hypothetical protein